MFTEREKDLIAKLNIDVDYNNISDKAYADIEEKVADHLEVYGFNDKYMPNSIGSLCESILDKLPI